MYEEEQKPPLGTVRPGGRGIRLEPNWRRAKVKQERLYPKDEAGVGPDGKPLPIMQTDLLKPFYLDIGNYGLNYAFQKLKIAEENPKLSADEVNAKAAQYKYTKTQNRKTVVIVGAGISGLVAAYELKKAGHEVKIIEAQHRVGGRIRTYADEYFYPGQWSDAGAMRIPGTGQIGGVSKHFLTDFYGQVLFRLPVQNFENQAANGYYFYGGNKYSADEWNADPGKYCDIVWPYWRYGLSEENMKKYNIVDIDSYYAATTQPVVNDIICANNKRPTADDWYAWSKRWSMFSVRGFLYGSFDEIKSKLQTYDEKHPDKEPKMWTPEMEKQLEPLKDLLPWSLDAVAAFTARSYSPGIDISLSELLRDPIGQWWEDPMHTFQGGMHSLPAAFMRDTPDDNSPDQHLDKDTRFGATVYKVGYDQTGVRVFYKNDVVLSPQKVNPNFVTGSGIQGDATIITLPLNIIRQVTFDPPLHTSITNSLSNVNYGPSTKIMLQCKEKFWQQGPSPINGGFSFTDLPISQLHYPTRLPDSDPKDRGVLMVYTWKQEALMFGSVASDAAIQIALDQIKRIHPEIEEYFEVGGVKAWYDDPYAQGAFCMLEPQQINGVTNELMYPTTNKENPADMIPQVYFAGEAISYCNGWIQGALESGLRAAYQFYARNEVQNK